MQDNKLKVLKLYSDINEVKRRAHELGLGDVYESSRKDKKYMLYDPYVGRMVHFGSAFYEDYTKHKDEKRRQNFLNRNKAWKNRYLYSPAYLSYTLLW